jgi:hypothetical protein
VSSGRRPEVNKTSRGTIHGGKICRVVTVQDSCQYGEIDTALDFPALIELAMRRKTAGDKNWGVVGIEESGNRCCWIFYNNVHDLSVVDEPWSQP